MSPPPGASRLTSHVPVPALADSPDFSDVVRAAAAHHGLLPALVTKDYWVTRVLRAIANDAALAGAVLFKGGTSLSKGWQLIDRFSEDIDLLLTGPAFGPMPPSKGGRERQFRHLRMRIEVDTPLRLPEQHALSREDWNFHYLRSDKPVKMRYPLPGTAITARSPSGDWLLVEAGYRGGVQPYAVRPLRSLIAEFLNTTPAARTQLAPYAADLAPFDMVLLKPERTLVEKLLALHVEMSQGIEGARRVRTRHYYDVAQLFARSEDARTCIERGEFDKLVRQAAIVSNTYFGTALAPEALDLRESPALNPGPEQVRVLAARYEDPAERALYYRTWMPFAAILEQVDALRQALNAHQ